MGNRTTRFLTVSLVLVSVFCVVVFSIQAAWNSAVGAEAITDIGVIYMSGMSEQIATHFGTTIELRLSQVGAWRTAYCRGAAAPTAPPCG